MVVSIATSHRRTLCRQLRQVAALGALGLAASLTFDLGASAQGACNLGKTCTVDVTSTAGFPGSGTATQVTPLKVDLTEFKADGTGKVKGTVPGAAVTAEIDKKTKKVDKVKVEKNKDKSKVKFKSDKNAKAGVKVKASKPR